MSYAIYTIASIEKIAEGALSSAPTGAINGVVCRLIESPWKEKIRLQNKRGFVEAVFHVWKSGECMEGRINRLARYVLDSFDPSFKYDPKEMLSLDADRGIRRAHNHIWSIYVDSRIEKMGLENFFDKSIRRNLFVDSQRAHPWPLLNRVFEGLWEKESFSHSEIIDYARNLRRSLDSEAGDAEALEVKMNRYRGAFLAKDFIAAIISPELRAIGDGLLQFVSVQCRGTLIEPFCYGMRLVSEGEVLAEINTTKRNFLISVFDFHTGKPRSCVLGSSSDDMETVQRAIKEVYDAISLRSRNRRSEEPLRVPM